MQIEGLVALLEPYNNFTFNLRHKSDSDILHVWDAFINFENITEIDFNVRIERRNPNKKKSHVSTSY